MSIDYRSILRATKRADLIATPRYEKWLLRGEVFPYRTDIADRIHQLLTSTPRDRSASFSASASGTCERAQIYGYLGVPHSDQVGTRLAAIFMNGHWFHMKTQAAWMAAGLFADPSDIEISLRWKKMRTRGTADGMTVVPMDHPHINWRGKEVGVEFKSANSRVYKMLQDDWHREPEKYKRQWTRYFNLAGFDLFDVWVENKDTNEHMEWVVEPDPAYIEADLEELTQLNWHVDYKKLPDRLPQCRKLSGSDFQNCPYGTAKGACALLTRFSDARKAGSS